jgi:hypothetical protein
MGRGIICLGEEPNDLREFKGERDGKSNQPLCAQACGDSYGSRPDCIGPAVGFEGAGF